MAQRSTEWMAFCTGLFQMVFVALCFVSRRDQVDAVTTWSPDGVVTVEKGEDLSVTCTVSEMSDVFDVIRIVHTLGHNSQTISDNEDIKAPYSKLSRYNVTYKLAGTTAIVTLAYHGIQPEDGGTLGCQILAGSTEGSSHLNITVHVPVSDIYVVAISSDGLQTRVEDERVVLEEKRHEGVGCVALVNGSADVPEIHVAIDDKDETPLFTSTINTTLVRLDSGLTLFKSERKMAFVTSHPNPDFNEKTLKCSVVGSAERDFATAVLSVKFAPVIDCIDTDLEAKVGDKVTVSCDIKASPSSRAVWKWTCESEERFTDQDNIAFNESAISKYRSHVQMTITQIKDSQFCGFLLMAENEIGTTNVTVELTKEEAEPVGNRDFNQEVVSNTRNSHLEALPPKQDQVIHEPQNGVSSQFPISEFLFMCQWTIVISTSFFYLL